MRLIDADELEEIKWNNLDILWGRGWNSAIDAVIQNATTVDAVEVVRCKDCKLFEPNTFPIRSGHPCSRVGLEPNDFCSWAEPLWEDEVEE